MQIKFKCLIFILRLESKPWGVEVFGYGNALKESVPGVNLLWLFFIIWWRWWQYFKIYLFSFLKNSMMHQEKITLGKIQAYWMYRRCNNEALSQFWGWEKGTLQRTSDKQQLKRATFLLFNWKFWVFSVFLLHKNVWVNLCGYQ